MITAIYTHDGKQWIQIGALANIGGEIGSDKLDFSLRGIGAHPISELSTTCPQAYRVRHKLNNPSQDIFYQFDAVVAGFEEGVLTLKFTSDAPEPRKGWTE